MRQGVLSAGVSNRKRYKLMINVLTEYTKGISAGILEDNFVYDAMLNYMDLLWWDMTPEERNSL